MDHKEAADNVRRILEGAGVVMSTRHIPTDYDPASKEWQGIKWAVTFKSKRGEFTTEYTQGIGHLPKAYEVFKSAYDRNRLIVPTLKTGFVHTLLASSNWVHRTKTPLTPPDIADVVYCLISDADVMNYARFEDWAADMGYDTDSRKGEATYRACQQIALDLNRVLGAVVVESLRTFTQDM